jgi:hypothetical protein
MSAVSRLVSIKNPVLNALQDMGIDVAADVPVFTRWAAWAERYGIDSYYSYCKKIEVLDLKDCCAELPCDAAFVQAVIIGDYGCECTDLFERFFSITSTTSGFSSDNTFLVIDATTQSNPIHTKVKWDTHNGHLRFKTQQTDTKVTIQYLGFHKDEQGFPMVLDTHLEAIVEYILYKFCVRSKFSPQKMTDSDRNFHYTNWHRLAIDARAEDARISDSERLEIVSMIHDPFIGYGMNVGYM